MGEVHSKDNRNDFICTYISHVLSLLILKFRSVQKTLAVNLCSCMFFNPADLPISKCLSFVLINVGDTLCHLK